MGSAGVPTGIFADIIAHIAATEGLRITYVYGSWEDNLRWVKSGEIDLALAVGMSRGETGEVSMNKFPVFFTWTQLFKPKGAPWGSILDLDGKRVGGLREDLNLILFKRIATEIGIHPVYVEDNHISDVFQRLTRKDVSVAVAERVTGLYYSRQYPVEMTPMVLSPRCFAFATAKGKNQDLLDMIDRHLLAEKNDPHSTYRQILAQWGEFEPFKIPAYVTWIIGPAVGLLILSVGGNMLLKRRVRLKTVELSARNRALEQEMNERQEAQKSLQHYREHLEEMVRDRTAELGRAKEAAEAANRSKSIFLASMSHELRTPLNAVLGFSQILRQDPTITGKQNQLLGIIERSGAHLLDLINEVLDISKIEEGRASLFNADFDLRATLQSVEEMMQGRARANRLGFLLEIAPEVPRLIHADQKKLKQVIINLAVNAIKFTECGSVTVRIRLDGQDTVLHVEVEDTGPGIPQEMIPKLFAPFVQAENNQEGTGLGLFISKRLVEIMGGTIVVESTMGQGSRFSFQVPYQPAQANDAALKPAPVPELRGTEMHGQILVAEDTLESRIYTSQVLASAGFKVIEAKNGLEAVLMFDQHAPALVVMDIRMPVMDGLEAIRRIKATARGKTTPIIAVSASSFKEEQCEILRAGADAFLGKPVSVGDLLAGIRRLLQQAEGDGASVSGPV